MNRGVIATWFLAISVAAGALYVSGRQYAVARGETARALGELDRVRAQAIEMASLRTASAAPASTGSRAQLTERVSAIIKRSGLPASALSAVSPDPERAVTGPSGILVATKRRAGIALAGLTLPQVGAFLAAWRAAEPSWVVSSLDLAPQTGETPAGRDLPLKVSMTLESIQPEGAAK